MKHRSSWSSACALLTVAFVSAGTLTPAFGEEKVAYDYTPLEQTSMTAVTTDSVATNEGSNGPINLVLDNNKDTYWHTAYDNPRTDPLPHHFVIDLGQKVENLGQVTLTPRQSSNGSGRVGKYSIETSVDPRCSAEATVASAEFQEATSGQQEAGQAYDPANLVNLVVNFDPRPARCVRVIYNSSWGGNSQPENVATLAEFNAATAVETDTPPAPEPPAPTPDVKNKGTGIITVESHDTTTWKNPSDTPAWPFIDKDGQFRYLHAAALYGADQPRHWQFFAGRDMDNMVPDQELNNSGTNPDTTRLCNTSPTGKESTMAPGKSRYSQKNFCDLINIWVDPDTGDWYGLVHNEFTPQPFGDGLHYDSIDYAISHDQGKSWEIPGHAITSPYSTVRGDEAAFPSNTYYYGDGDPRLYVDYRSGYFYAFYGSRIVNKRGTWITFHEHVARAPISGKMKTGTWQKWYNGKWEEPGIKGKESNIIPVTEDNPTGYTPIDKEYNPKNPGTAQEQVRKGLMPGTSPLFVMDITYNAYLGMYIGQPQHKDQSGKAPQEYYATDNLATQKWVKIGDTGDAYQSASWYRWFLDTANKTNTAIVGKNFRAYCSFGCMGGKYSDLINLSVVADKPYEPVDALKIYTIANGQGAMLMIGKDGTSVIGGTKVTKANGAWTFKYRDDGSYLILSQDGKALGVDPTKQEGRAWDASLTVTDLDEANVGQQWFVMPTTDPTTGDVQESLRLVNRYSGLTLAINDEIAGTAPQRTWDAEAGTATKYTATAHQVITLAEYAEPAPEKPKPEKPKPDQPIVDKAPDVKISKETVAQGDSLIFTIAGVKPGAEAEIVVHSDPVKVGSFIANEKGMIEVTWSVPENFAPGTHTVHVSSPAFATAKATFTVIVQDTKQPTPPQPKQPQSGKQDIKSKSGQGLAQTGVAVPGLLMASTLLVGCGIALQRRNKRYA
ncbi:discoidin domain-containing protein [Arcanobacterium phocae]|uniref:discoidin domain-containing protein n=1 Tax=Arcanobacterium phocae TaxID=131112 RepID=UPI001C0F6F7A|nr:discoidin domain-containing protein [Arcanobacterium phocae]